MPSNVLGDTVKGVLLLGGGSGVDIKIRVEISNNIQFKVMQSVLRNTKDIKTVEDGMQIL